MNRRVVVGAVFVVLGLTALYVGLVNYADALSGDPAGCHEYHDFGPQIAANGGIVYDKGPCYDYRYENETFFGSLLFGLGFVGYGSHRMVARGA